MGILDFALYPGRKWSKQEIDVLDKNFNSVSNYTGHKYDFDFKYIDKDIRIDNSNSGPFHEISYKHNNIKYENQPLHIPCRKYKISDRNELAAVVGFYEMYYSSDEDEWRNIKVPKINKFPTNLLQVGWHGLGFINILKYDNDGYITPECQKLIRRNCIKFLKNVDSDENWKDIDFE